MPTYCVAVRLQLRNNKYHKPNHDFLDWKLTYRLLGLPWGMFTSIFFELEAHTGQTDGWTQINSKTRIAAY